MKHQKHTHLERPDSGNWSRNEWSIVGGKCSDIKDIAHRLISKLSEFKSLYIDADHKENSAFKNQPDSMVDKIGKLQWNLTESHNKYAHRPRLTSYNLILVNGNHFQARRQIVILDKDKATSLKKRIDQLSQVDIVIIHPNMDGQSFDYFDNYLSNASAKPLFIKWDDITSIAEYLSKEIAIPDLKALILVGGQSQRMGQDKAQLTYHGLPQFEYIYQLLSKKVSNVYISCTKEQENKYKTFQTIKDTFIGLGPIGGILSAFRQDPNAAWLVVACDLPLVNEKTIDQLINARDPWSSGTAFKSSHSPWMEPLISIYEPSIYPIALSLLSQGYSCARKVMINAPVKIIQAENEEWLTNVNTPEDLNAISLKN